MRRPALPPAVALLRAFALLSAFAVAGASCALTPPPFAQLSGLLLDERLGEASGLATSGRHDDVLWVVNDGGNGALVHAIGTRGQHLAAYRLEGVANTDWEDLGAFELDGRHYLLVADIGDNGGLRHTLQLHAVEEPGRLASTGAASGEPPVLPVAWTVAFRWPDGPRDSEAIAVDAATGRVLLVSKRRDPPELFSVPLRPGTTEVQVAEPLGTLAGVPRASDQERADDPERARLRGQVTAADISPDGRTLAILTYDDVLLYPRGDGDWAAAVARPPRVHPLTLLPQAEALAWTADSLAMYATGEFRPAPLMRLTPD